MNPHFNRDLLLQRLSEREPASYFLKQARDYILELEERIHSMESDTIPKTEHVADLNRCWDQYQRTEDFYREAILSGDPERIKAAADTCTTCFKRRAACECVWLAAAIG